MVAESLLQRRRRRREGGDEGRIERERRGASRSRRKEEAEGLWSRTMRKTVPGKDLEPERMSIRRKGCQ